MEEKDPAFLFYPKDWIQGTAQMMPNEKGIYIDLLAHQHQNNHLPNDTKRLARIVGLSEVDFLPIWDGVKSKFVVINGNHLVNQKLTKVTTKRSTKSLTKKIAGTFASIIRISKVDPEIKKQIKKKFKVNDFLTKNNQDLTNVVTIWYNQMVAECLEFASKSIGNGNSINNTVSNNNNTLTNNIIVESKKTFNTMPIVSDFNGLPVSYQLSSIEIVKITKQKDIDNKTVIGLWEIFKVQNLTGSNHYPNEGKVYSHFIHWIKTQNFENGNSKTSTGNKLSPSEARQQANRDY